MVGWGVALFASSNLECDYVACGERERMGSRESSGEGEVVREGNWAATPAELSGFPLDDRGETWARLLRCVVLMCPGLFLDRGRARSIGCGATLIPRNVPGRDDWRGGIFGCLCLPCLSRLYGDL
jgi:hypothetical protein